MLGELIWGPHESLKSWELLRSSLFDKVSKKIHNHNVCVSGPCGQIQPLGVQPCLSYGLMGHLLAVYLLVLRIKRWLKVICHTKWILLSWQLPKITWLQFSFPWPVQLKWTLSIKVGEPTLWLWPANKWAIGLSRLETASHTFTFGRFFLQDHLLFAG